MLCRCCKDCRLILDTSAHYCPNCGRSLAGQQNLKVETLLRSAKYHRSRQHWDAALADVIAVLRIEPRNPAGPALLAEIYEQRGMLDEARIWRQAANELRSSSTYRVSPQACGTGRSWMVGRWQWLILLLAIAIAITATTIWITQTENRRAPKQVVNQATLRSPSDRNIVIPNSQAAPSASEQVNRNGALRTAAEQMIQAELNGSAIVAAARVSIDDVIADPRTGTVIVTYSMVVLSSPTKVSVVDAAIRIARVVCASHAEVISVTLRCIANVPSSHNTQILFVGDITRDALSALKQPASIEAATAAFKDQWWNPQVK